MGFWEWGFEQLFFSDGGSGLKVWGLGISVQRFELRLQGSEIRVWDMGCRLERRRTHRHSRLYEREGDCQDDRD